MPTFDMTCPKCGHESAEFFNTMDTTRHVAKCPKCDADMKKDFGGGAPEVLLKGSGFHATDYPRG